MTFPLESLTQTSAGTDASADSAHDMLITHAIARQSLSPSARAYGARRRAQAATPMHSSGELVEDRIRLFAGGASRKDLPTKSERAYRKGNFRPDLLRENLSDNASQEEL